VVVVGGGQSGAQFAVALRALGFKGSIGILCAECDPPYERPPLCKEYLAGGKPFEHLLFRSDQEWRTLGVNILFGERACSIDPTAHRVKVNSGRSYGYSKLVWAAGGSARTLNCAGANAAGIHSIRSRADVDSIRIELPDAKNVVVVGGGYIGLESAAVIAQSGKRVCVVEALDRVLARVAGEPLSRFYEVEHRARGVEIRLGRRVSAIEESKGRCARVCLDDGTLLPAELVVVGVGMSPEVEALVVAGAVAERGVRVNAHCQTSIEDVYAIGDCVEQQSIYARGEWVSVESVHNANQQAMIAARAICGLPFLPSTIPWFWSNQYDLRLQTVGLSQIYDDLVVRGDPATRSFSLIYLHDGKVAAIDSVNAVRDYSHARFVIAADTKVDRSRLADPTVPLKSIAQAGS